MLLEAIAGHANGVHPLTTLSNVKPNVAVIPHDIHEVCVSFGFV
jgi:hypothetical protein